MVRFKTCFPLFLLHATLLIGCTAHYPVNEPLDAARVQTFDANVEWYHNSGKDLRTLILDLAFSGGGTRAAAFSYGLLEELARTKIEWEGRERRMVDEIDSISSVSGGSFTAAYYGLFGERIFEDFEDKFLKRDVQGELISRVTSPLSWFKLGSDMYGRSELAAHYYDEILFEGATFGDMAASGGPFIQINASDAGLGVQFPFVPQLFNAMCSDWSKFSVSRAVTASSAVPVVFNSLTVRNYAGSCGYQLPDWMREALSEPDRTTRRYHVASQYAKYLDRDAKPYVHLYDGGITDNLGVRPFLSRLAIMGDPWEMAKNLGFEDLRRLLVIVVNSQKELEPKFNQREKSLGLMQSISSSSSIPLNEYTFESMTLLRQLSRDNDAQITKGRCAERSAVGESTEGCDDMRTYVVEISFNKLPDKERRLMLEHLPTSFRLAPEEVDALRAAAGEILRNSPEFQRFLRELKP